MAIQSSYHAGIDHLGHHNDNIHLPNKLNYCHQHKIRREDCLFSLVTMQAWHHGLKAILFLIFWIWFQKMSLWSKIIGVILGIVFFLMAFICGMITTCASCKRIVFSNKIVA